MALIGNRSVINKSPGRFLSGTVAAGNRNNFSQRGMLRGAFENFSKLSAWPSGHLSPSAWMLPQKAGGMSSRNVTRLDVAAAASGAMGVNGVGTSSLTFTAEATAELIASAIGSATFTVTASGSALATLNGTGTASFTLTTSGTMGALAWGIGAASMQVTATMTSYGVGFMIGSTIDASVLTAEQIADAVWAKTLP